MLAHHLRPSLLGIEALDARILPSLPAAEIGQVSSPGQISKTSAEVSARNLTRRRPSTLVEVATRALPGSALKPTQKAVRGASGVALPTLELGYTGKAARSIARVSRAGTVSTAVTGRERTVGSYRNSTTLAGDINGDGRVDQQDIPTILAAYPSVAGQKKYNPAADLNHNGQVGQSDLRILIRNLPAPKKQPLRVVVNVAPSEAANYKHMPTNLGGHTFRKDITLVIRTTPGSLILEDSGLGDYSFQGRAIIANERGIGRLDVANRDGINTYNFLVIDPFGAQVIRSYPVYWLSRAYQAD